MRKTLYLLLLFTFACSSDDDESENNEIINQELLIGEWGYTRYSYEEDGVETTSYETNECTSQARYVFYSNNEFYKMSSNGTLESCTQGELRGTYFLSGDTLSLSTMDRSATIEVTSTTLILKFIACNFACENYNLYRYERVSE